MRYLYLITKLIGYYCIHKNTVRFFLFNLGNSLLLFFNYTVVYILQINCTWLLLKKIIIVHKNKSNRFGNFFKMKMNSS
jgi:hypothetical protein